MQQENKCGDFRDLEIWQKCREIRRDVWELCKAFPKMEQYRLSDQMIRSSRSSTACIAEGYGRFHYQENIQFCRQSRGSLYELIDHLDTAENSGYIDNNQMEYHSAKIRTAIQVLNGYIRYLNERKTLIR